MSDHRRRASVIAVGAASMALLASPFATLAQDDGMAAVSEACQATGLDGVLKNAGRLTVSTDNPAFFPWWSGAVPEDDPEWATFGQYPPSGEGFEGGIAYAVADALGFSADQVDWIGQAEFGLAFAPGDKDFDFHLGQVTITDQRAEAVDFSDSYWDATQSVLALAENPITGVTTLEELKDYSLAAPGNTTSFRIIEDVIQPNVEPKAPQDIATATQQLVNGNFDGLVVDTPTGYYIRDGMLPWEPFETEGVIVGQVTQDGDEAFGLVLEKDSGLTACINEAIAAVRDSGKHQELLEQWVANAAPILE